MPSRVGIYPQEKVVLQCSYLDSTIKIPILEGAIEYKLIWWKCWIHSLEGSIEERGAVVVIVSKSLLITPNNTFM